MNIRNSNQAIKQIANNEMKRAVIRAKQSGTKVLAIEEMTINGKTNSDKITLTLANANAGTTYDMVFGTPVGIATEYTAVPYATTLPDIMFTGLADLTDNQGASIPFLQLLNKRFVRKPVYVSHIEVITPDTALGNSQKSEGVNRFIIPYNSATDTGSVVGSFIPQYTEYTAVALLDTGIILGEFSGFSYKLLPSSSVKMNIYLAALKSIPQSMIE